MQVSLAQEFWCLYNSPFLNTVISFVAFGSIALILPKVFAAKKKQIENDPTPLKYQLYCRIVRRMRQFGTLTFLSSLISVGIYMYLYVIMKGVIAYDKIIKSTPSINPLVIFFLYISSACVLIFFGIFYHFWKKAESYSLE
jgi:hypothetical protein